MIDTSIGDQDAALSRLADTWREYLAATPSAASALARGLGAHRAELADLFYATLLDDPRAARFLSQGQVRQRLHPGLQRWLRDLLEAGADTVDALIATNLQVGIVHARIGIPVDLVGRGARVLREAMVARLAASKAEPETAFAAVSAVNASIDLALECMTLAYADANDHSSRTDAAYRLFSLAQNIGTERERQRALLLDWENDLLYALAGKSGAGGPGPLSESEFGLWLLHKGIPIIGENDETGHVRRLMAEIDALLAPGAAGRLAELPPQVFDDVRRRLSTIRQLLASLLGRIGELEAGADALTKLLNRRFLPTVLRREIELAGTHGHDFSLVALDIDHFKRINDTYGHDAGDRALQHVANMLTQSVRSSDYVFRLGGEEFLIVLVGTGLQQARGVAEALRQRITHHLVPLSDGREFGLTASLGVAGYDGHPDYERLLSRADQAMYAAKRNGRNCVVIADGNHAAPVRVQ